MGFWLTEKHTEGYSVNWKFIKTLYADRSDYQHIAVIDTLEFGRALILDGVVQTTEKDEFIYHEMIVHPVMMSHPEPQKVLVIGGGDGGAIREAIKYKSVKQADLVEIDDKVIWASREFLPEVSCALSDKKVRILVEDGLQFIKNKQAYYDVIFIDSSDPVGPAKGLFSREFYSDAYNALKEDGIMVAQTESPTFNKNLLADVHKALSGMFPITKTYLTAIATYIGGFWTFTIGSKHYDPATTNPDSSMVNSFNLKYYNEEIHRASFVLPNYIKKIFD